MHSLDLIRPAIYFLVILVLTPPLGKYLKKVFAGESTLLDPLLSPLERWIYRLSGIEAVKEQGWLQYALALLVFNGVGIVTLYALLRLQGHLPFNPDRLPGVPAALAWNTAVSFVTNTDWQNYGGESTMSHLSQTAGLAVHNFLSAATGLAVAIAVIRGAARAQAKTIGNFWRDLTRATLWVLLPVSLAAAGFFVSQGVVQNFSGTKALTTAEGGEQRIAQGPVASQEAIKMFGTNGGGFFNANSAHPYENPTPLTDFLQMVLIFAVGAGLTRTLGVMVGKPGHGWALFAAMSFCFLAAAGCAIWAEDRGNPIHHALGVSPFAGNLAGKEVRFGAGETALFATVTTDASCGAVNGMHDSFTPLGGLVPLVNIQLSEVVFGGVGAGLYGIFLYVVLAVFIAGLMVGRTPEYLGKKLEAHEVKLAMLAVLAMNLTILVAAAVAVLNKAGLAGLNNAGPHGLSEILYAYASAAGNNGSAFGGLNGNSNFYNLTLGLAMLIGRYLMIIPVLAIAGSLAAKKRLHETAGTFPVDGPIFAVLLIAVLLIVVALTFFPVVALGPVVEHLLMGAGKTF